MKTPKSDIVQGLFPKWQATAEILEWAEDLMRPFTEEQIRAASRQHKTERGRAFDPDIADMVRRLKGEGQRHAVQVKDARQLLDEYNNRPYTEEDRQWCQMMDSWKLQLRHDMALPGFLPNQWARANFRDVAKDLAPHNITGPQFIGWFIRLVGRACGVTFTPAAKDVPGPTQGVVRLVASDALGGAA